MVEQFRGAVLDKAVEFVAASQAGQEAIYLRALLRGFNFRQVGATEIWEDNASCIMMSENPADRERTRHVDTRVSTQGESEIGCDSLGCRVTNT